MYLKFWPCRRHGQHSITYPIPSVVHFGSAIRSSLAGLGIAGWPGSGIGLSVSSTSNISLLLHCKHPYLSHISAFDQGLLLPSSSPIVCPQQRSINLTPGVFIHSPKVSSTSCRAFLRMESLANGMNTGDSSTFTLLSCFPDVEDSGDFLLLPSGCPTFHLFVYPF